MLPLIGPKTFETRGHCLKIQKRYCRTKLRANFFGFLTVNMWNGLSDDVVLSPTLNSFKGRIDRHWRSLRYSVFWWCHCLLMIWFNGSDLISPKANNGLLQPRLQDDNDDVVFVLFCPMFQFITFEIVQGRSRSRVPRASAPSVSNSWLSCLLWYQYHITANAMGYCVMLQRPAPVLPAGIKSGLERPQPIRKVKCRLQRGSVLFCVWLN